MTIIMGEFLNRNYPIHTSAFFYCLIQDYRFILNGNTIWSRPFKFIWTKQAISLCYTIIFLYICKVILRWEWLFELQFLLIKKGGSDFDHLIPFLVYPVSNRFTFLSGESLVITILRAVSRATKPNEFVLFKIFFFTKNSQFQYSRVKLALQWCLRL